MLFLFYLFGLSVSLWNETIKAEEQYNDIVEQYNEILNKTNELIDKKCESYEMYTVNTTEFGPTGVYFGNSHYCVWTKDRNITEIATTEVHEICHVLIRQDNKTHFCK